MIYDYVRRTIRVVDQLMIHVISFFANRNAHNVVGFRYLCKISSALNVSSAGATLFLRSISLSSITIHGLRRLILL